MATMKYDGVGFSIAVVKSMSRQEFVSHPMHENHYLRLKPEDKRKVLNQVYNLITGVEPKNKKRRDQ